MMKEWYATKELVGLPGMPKTTQGVNCWGRRTDSVKFRPRKGKGGGKEYHISAFPEATKDALYHQSTKEAEQAAAKLPIPAPPKQVAKTPPRVLQNYTDLKTWQRDVFDARLPLYNEFLAIKKLHGTSKAVEKMLTMAQTETLPETLQPLVSKANARRGKNGRSLSKSMILGWHRVVKKEGIMGLVPVPVRDRRIPEWAAHFVKCYGTPDKPSLSHAMERMEKVLPEGMAMPSYHQVRRFHIKRSRYDRELGRRTGSDLKALKGYRKRDTSDMFPLEVGVCDGHSFKSKVAHPFNGNPFKPEICSVVDVATRVLLGWSVGLAESALTVSGAIRHAASVTAAHPRGGILNILYADAGSGNKAKINADEAAGIFPRIGTTLKIGTPGNPQGHGIIEVLNKNLWVRAAKDLPTYVGSSMDSLTKRNMYLLVNREIKKNGVSTHLPSWPQFLEHCAQSVEAYNNRPHSALPKINDPETGRRRHLSPIEMWDLHVANGWDAEEHQLTEQELDIMFLPRQERVVQRSSVEIFSNTYVNNILQHYEGQKMQVGYDIHNGDRVQIWDKEGRMICYAMFEKNRTSFMPSTDREIAANNRAKHKVKIKLNDLDAIESERQGVIDLVAQKAKVIDITPASPTITVDKDALQQEMVARATAITIPEDDKGKFLLWNELDSRIDNGEELAKEEKMFYGAYVNSASYKAFKSVADTLGQQTQQVQ